MKKIAYLLSIGFIVSLFGCGAPAASPKPTTVNQQTASQKVIDTDNAKLKTEAVKADFAEINGHYDKVKAKAVYFEGKVSDVVNTYGAGIPNFIITQGGEMFYIVNESDTPDLKNGDTAKIYGRVTDPKEGHGMPTIMSTLIEKTPSKN